MTLTDVNIVVVRKNYSTIDKLEFVEEALQSGKIPNAAFVFNSVIPQKYAKKKKNSKQALVNAV